MSLRKCLVLALLTLLLVTTIKPSVAVSSFIQSPLSQLEAGQQSYNAGKLAQAVQLWQQAVEKFKQQGDSNNQAASYKYLAIVYQDLGQWDAAQKAISQALKLSQGGNNALLQAQILNTQGSLLLNLGQPQAALETWQRATECYRDLKDVTGIVLSQINQAQALQALGLYRRAKNTLLAINQDLAGLPESLLKVKELRSLGVTLQIVGDLQESQAVLGESLALAKRLNAVGEVGETAFSLGNTARARGDFQQAIALYQQAAESASNSLTQLEAQLNQLSLWLKMKQKALALTLLPQIKARLVNLAPSRGGIYAQVNFAESLSKLSSASNAPEEVKLLDIAQILAKAVQQARVLKDPRVQAYALGQFGHLYEQSQQWEPALTLTNQALVLAQEIRATDIAGTWHWQQGRILKAQGKVTSAIAAYDQAVNALRSLRQDLVAVNPDVQFSFREQVEPVYRQFVQLLLQDVDKLPEATQQQHLRQSRATIEALQLAELENFFREACLTFKAKPIEEIDQSAAVIYPIILDQRLEVVLSLPGQPLKHYGTELDPGESTRVSNQLRQSLNLVFQPTDVLPAAQKVYDWLLRPAQADLESQNIKTLVFVLDGFLRRLPLAVLHDGKQYLVERYNLALNPGLQLLESPADTQTNSRTLASKQFKTLAVGLTEARQGFIALPGVAAEIKQVAEKTSAQVLLDRNFTRLSLQKKVDAAPFSLVHLATHGQFSSKAEDTFLLTWDSRINVKDLDQLLRGQAESSTIRSRQPIELLVLSACQTAQGDNRATLGLAGVAIRSGARSTLATLWSVDDQSTAQLMSEFYRLFLQGNSTKAEALRQAQLSLLRSTSYQHPYYWAPFVLVGNWR